jgi:hypothetical protein
MLVGAGLVVAAYLQRIGPQYPAVAGTPFAIPLDTDGCPVTHGPQAAPFVDSPGQFVPLSPTEVVLCTTPTIAGPAPTPKQRVLQQGAADFAETLNRMPDRNQWSRDWQRTHSGLWPDAEVPVDVCTLMLPAYKFSFVLRYADGSYVGLVTNCTGWTTGARTRIDAGNPGVLGEFLARFKAQT